MYSDMTVLYYCSIVALSYCNLLTYWA